jgi:hypothetical protein
MKKKILFSIFIVLISLLIISCSQNTAETVSDVETQEIIVPSTNSSNWQEIDFADIITGQTFKITDFSGKIVLLESFAVWCPTCTRQQEHIQEFHSLATEIITISLDTDPNENIETVKNHIQSNNFEGIYAIAPREMTQSLIDEFGIRIVNAPSVPIVLICDTGDTRLLARGLKNPEKLQQEIVKGC